MPPIAFVPNGHEAESWFVLMAPSGTPQALGGFIAKETAKWKDVVRISGAKLD